MSAVEGSVSTAPVDVIVDVKKKIYEAALRLADKSGGKGKYKDYRLRKTILIGRGDVCDIQIDLNRVSRMQMRVIVDNENIMFPTISGKYINIRLRWQNVSGLCNPSWQFNVKDLNNNNTTSKKRTRKKSSSPTKSKTKMSRTVAGPVVSILKGILRQNNLKVSGTKSQLLQR